LQANESTNYPSVSEWYTGNIIPEDSILKLIEGLTSIVPISVDGGTYRITNTIGNIKSKIYADNKVKIETSITTFEKFVDVDDFSKIKGAFEAEE
jgi:phosphate acetyltransferase